MAREFQNHNQDNLTDTNFIFHAKVFTNFILSYTITRVTVTSELKTAFWGTSIHFTTIRMFCYMNNNRYNYRTAQLGNLLVCYDRG